eukprot:TRINITY_DN6199_c0_g3_i2.p1 TRINITY_DN6199_c0_g3~~TRINITY_DN6199_c0_g3_i2.p1  ORF type:complete len:500 (+),score=55.07 TRINITY_DN6199_c0_g3_i2:230-1729(+)
MGVDVAKAVSESIQSTTFVTTLKLEHCNIGLDGARYLAGLLTTNTSVTHLDLESNKIDAAAASLISDSLKLNTCLTSLALERNNITGTGAAAFAGMLRVNSVLQHLNLNRNQIGEAGALALAGALSENNTLLSLDLGWSAIGDTGAFALADALSRNRKLTSLNLDHNYLRDDSLIAILNRCHPGLWIAVGKRTCKREGTVISARFSGTGLPVTIFCYQCNDLSPIAMCRLRTHCDDADRPYWIERIRYSTRLPRHPLYIFHPRITVDAALQLAQVVKDSGSVSELMMVNNGLGSAGAIAVASVLETYTRLAVLGFPSNQLGDAGASAVASIVRSNPSLTKLDVRSNNIGDVGIEVLVDALRSCPNVQTLLLHDNCVGSTSCRVLANFLRVSASLTMLSTGGGNVAALLLADALKQNKSLTSLQLLGTMSEDGSQALVQMLSENTTLLELRFDVGYSNALIGALLERNKQLSLQVQAEIRDRGDRFRISHAATDVTDTST